MISQGFQVDVESVEFLRADVEGAMKSYPIVAGMLAAVAGITIFLSLQRLIQSQAKLFLKMQSRMNFL